MSNVNPELLMCCMEFTRIPVFTHNEILSFSGECPVTFIQNVSVILYFIIPFSIFQIIFKIVHNLLIKEFRMLVDLKGKQTKVRGKE